MRTWVWQLHHHYYPDTVIWITELGEGRFLYCTIKGNISVSSDQAWIDQLRDHPDWWEELTS